MAWETQDGKYCNNSTTASVWYVFTPNAGHEGYNIQINRVENGTEGPLSVEVYRGVLDQGCNGGFSETLDFSCVTTEPTLLVPNCFEAGEVIFVKVATNESEDNCGEFEIIITPVSCGPMNDECFEAEIAEPLMPVTNTDFSIDYLCVNGCLAFACPEDDPNGGCTEFIQNPTVWYKVEVDDIAAQMFTTVETSGNWTPVWSIYSGNSCNDLEIVNFGGTPACSNGDNTPELHQIGVFDEISTYWIAITATDIPEEGIADGSFELCVSTTINAIICVGEEIGDCGDPSLIMEVTDRENSGQPLDGPFCQGEEVTINVSFFYDATESGADWLIGFVPIFGEGWDLTKYRYKSYQPETDRLRSGMKKVEIVLRLYKNPLPYCAHL